MSFHGRQNCYGYAHMGATATEMKKPIKRPTKKASSASVKATERPLTAYEDKLTTYMRLTCGAVAAIRL